MTDVEAQVAIDDSESISTSLIGISPQGIANLLKSLTQSIQVLPTVMGQCECGVQGSLTAQSVCGDGDTVRNEDRGDDNDAIELAEIVRQYTQEPIVTLSPEEIASWTEEHVRSFDGQFSIVSSHRFGANHDEKSSMKCMLYVED
jgi:hypothetical protein